jgi:hypothetical protein
MLDGEQLHGEKDVDQLDADEDEEKEIKRPGRDPG